MRRVDRVLLLHLDFARHIRILASQWRDRRDEFHGQEEHRKVSSTISEW